MKGNKCTTKACKSKMIKINYKIHYDNNDANNRAYDCFEYYAFKSLPVVTSLWFNCGWSMYCVTFNFIPC